MLSRAVSEAIGPIIADALSKGMEAAAQKINEKMKANSSELVKAIGDDLERRAASLINQAIAYPGCPVKAGIFFDPDHNFAEGKDE